MNVKGFRLFFLCSLCDLCGSPPAAACQQRLTLEGDLFYIDLVFYHTVLKCHVLIDLKVGKLTHEDLGQLQLYVNCYDRYPTPRTTIPPSASPISTATEIQGHVEGGL